ncbi:MAG TPA: ammonium transporter [Candidatus Didemnitutus sp.]|nr:ammonium transporter [Candidatus Didemnitutus sp.]
MRNRHRFLILAALAAALPVAVRADTAAPVAVDSGITAWMLTSTALVLLMVPGLAIFYGGLVRAKNVLGTMMHSFAAMAVVGVLWATVGYAMFFGSNVLGGLVGWNSSFVFLRGLDGRIMSSGVPEYVFAMFQGKFAIITPALIAGAVAERITFKGWVAFISLWIVLVYAPLSHWVWAPDGYFFNLGAGGAIDYAGGTVVHISSGVSGLVLALFLGRRWGYPKLSTSPNNLTLVLLGAGLLWVGWFGFNAGSSVASNLETARALTVTQVAAATGALTWMIIEGVIHGKATSLGLASGILAGLVAITPAAGVVGVPGAMVLGVAAAIGCYLMISLKNKLGYDDSLDAFGVHGTGGIIGALGLVFFIREPWWVDAAKKVPGWGIGNQLRVQLTAVGATIVFAAIMTLLIGFVVEKTIGLRLNESDEKGGMDHALHGERGYGLNNLN